jgi:hypothetical protein
LDQWEEANIPEAEQIARRAGMGLSLNLGSYVLFARIKTLMGRDLKPHDIAYEQNQRAQVSVTHSLGGPNGRRNWYQAVRNVLEQVADEGISQLATAEQKPETWANTRALWLPGGSSSIKDPKWHQRHGEFKSVINKCAASKKLTHANRPMSLHDILARKAQICTRAATKNEPGLKKRPLHAADDYSYLAAAYASAGLEKVFSVRGSVMRQKPNDVIETTSAVQSANKNRLVLCIDYSDYNKTHTITTRVMLNLLIAKQLQRHNRQNQAAAARWIAEAHTRHYINGVKINQGLSSGERDTARDNTTLHLAYAQVAYNAAGYNGQINANHFFRCCGDDEIIVGMTWEQALDYTDELQMEKHILQKRKILLSQTHGEFLQYNMFADGRLPQQPLAPAIINFVSGSWYKATNYDPIQIPKQVADASAGLYRRGMDMNTARKLTISCCNWLCEETAWRKRLNATDLFGAEQPMPDEPQREALQTITATDMQKTPAVRDYVNYVCAKYPELISDGNVHSVTRMAWNSVYAQPIAEVTKRVKIIEKDDDIVNTPKPKNNVDTYKLTKQWLNAPANDRTDPMELLAFACGLPAKMLKTTKLVMQAYSSMTPGQRSLLNYKCPGPWQLPWYERIVLPGAAAGLVC